MNNQYHIYWTKTAQRDLVKIIKYIQADHPKTASNIFEKIKEKTQELELFGERGRIIPELQIQGIMQYRELIIPPWRIMYRISMNTVYVLSVLDSRRNVEDILLERLISINNENPLP
jgi:addiction module RelE/StbE family toxin